MRKLVLPFCLAMLFVSQFGNLSRAQGLQQSLVGNWQLDVGETKKLGPDSAKQFAVLGGFDVALKFHFKKGGVLSMIVEGSQNDSVDLGKWSVLSEDSKKKQLTLRVSTDNDPKSSDKIVIEFVDQRRIKATTIEKDSKKQPPFILRRTK